MEKNKDYNSSKIVEIKKELNEPDLSTCIGPSSEHPGSEAETVEIKKELTEPNVSTCIGPSSEHCGSDSKKTVELKKELIDPDFSTCTGPPSEHRGSKVQLNHEIESNTKMTEDPGVKSHKKTTLSLESKMQLLRDYDKKMKQSELAAKYGISKSTVCVLIKNRVSIEKVCAAASFHPSRKRMRVGKEEKLDEALYAWFKETQEMNLSVSTAMLISAANDLAQNMNIYFTPSSGWLDRFKKRRGIKYNSDYGDLSMMEPIQPDEWRRVVLSGILKDYHPNDIFNAHETGIYYKCLPDMTFALKGVSCDQGEKAEDRLTILVAVNMSGTEKLPLLIIGKHSKPQHFKHVQSLPTDYASYKKAWMTSTIFESWLRKLDTNLYRQNRQIVMLVDKCPAHRNIDNLRAIKLVYPPHNSISVLQPHQGIIQALKKLYRKRILEKYLLHLKQTHHSPQVMKTFNIDILEGMYMLQNAWMEVGKSLISDCFRYAGFELQSDSIQENQLIIKSESQSPQEIDNEFQDVFSSLRNYVQFDVSSDEFCQFDDTLVTCESASSKSTMGALFPDRQSNSDSESEKDETGHEGIAVTAEEARAALDVLKKFSCQQEHADELLDIVFKCDSVLDQVILKGIVSDSLNDSVSVDSSYM